MKLVKIIDFLYLATNVVIWPKNGLVLGSRVKHFRHLKTKILKFLKITPRAIVFPKTNSTVDYLSIVDSLLYDVDYIMGGVADRIAEINGQLKLLRRWLMRLQHLVKGAKVSQLSDDFMQIIDVAYESEYLISSFVVGDAPLWYLAIRLAHINAKKNKLDRVMLRLMNKNSDVGDSRAAEDFIAQPHPTRRDSADDVMVGFEDLERDILDQLVAGGEQCQFISIIGMPGIGKTTLAKKLYTHQLVSHHFDKSLWCVISQVYNLKNLLITILMSLRSERDDDELAKMDEESLALQMYKILKDRRYLIVMDDIWSSNVWDDLHRYFPDDKNGSRIIFTSRNKDVALPGSIIHEIPLLSDDKCWKLLKMKVFGDNPCPPQLEDIGKKITAKCYGLPLAVVVISGILSTVENEEGTWKNIGESLDPYLFSEQSNSVMRILELSYKQLPTYLKPCFLYFGVFQEDAEIPVKKLKQLWIAEGFVQEEDNTRSDSVAEEYLKELIAKSLVLIVKRRSNGGAKACAIHDLLRDLCLRISEKENFAKLVDHDCSIWNQKFHHLSVQMNQSYFALPCHLAPYSARVRSFSCCGSERSFSLLNMRSLRVLHFQQQYSNHDYSGIQNLVHLRYMAINSIPSGLHLLMNLEFLTVNNRIILYTPLLQMAKLRYLSSESAFFPAEGRSTEESSKLEFLSEILISKEEDEEMMKCFPLLRKLKCMYKMFERRNGEYAFLDLHFLDLLESLTVTVSRWDSGLSSISIPFSIKKLNLCNLQLPWESISIIGLLPNLVVLKLRYQAFQGEIWSTNDDEFKQLRYLKLEWLDLNQWDVSSSDHFPRLQRLVLHDCCDLEMIPSEIGGIATLELIEVRGKCRKSVEESVMQIQQEQLDMGDENLRVDIQLDDNDVSSDEDSSPASSP
ncbi:putative late blight resistance protein homolog R1B-16 isoform X2 [Andrographis paniculata]|uniref:putative late blight resistance protein homolog R1B-16 isoform X2 n=1 Tax=Andrographis paniculata TaxID=175694 RepID=UPI0021E93190|nr:putative late blight resistance protein homolog R1B-16 isoform X2 [Andrographis paniculata]